MRTIITVAFAAGLVLTAGIELTLKAKELPVQEVKELY